MSTQPVVTDTRDMKWVHDGFRRAFGDAPGQIAAVSDRDTQKAQNLAGYLEDVFWLLHAHHGGEDELLYPLLFERVPESKDLFSRMEGQHAAVTPLVASAEAAAEQFGKTGAGADGEALAAACNSLLVVLSEHLTEEENEVVPIASRVMTPQEWGALPAHAISLYTGSRLWLPLGIATETFPDEMRAGIFSSLGLSQDAFIAEMATIRLSAS